jgi:hypothetical protein
MNIKMRTKIFAILLTTACGTDYNEPKSHCGTEHSLNLVSETMLVGANNPCTAFLTQRINGTVTISLRLYSQEHATYISGLGLGSESRSITPPDDQIEIITLKGFPVQSFLSTEYPFPLVMTVNNYAQQGLLLYVTYKEE